MVDDFTCSCVPGWVGKTCSEDLNECLEVQCQNNGTCIVSTTLLIFNKCHFFMVTAYRTSSTLTTVPALLASLADTVKQKLMSVYPDHA